MEKEESELFVSPGDVVAGKYHVEEDLGSGGMAFVVAARHVDLDERFALKFLLPSLAKRKDVVERFTREAKAACRIRSEHVARVHDVGTHRGVPFLVMEHLVGRDLAAVVAERGPLPVELAVEYAIQACDALAAAHAQGIVHRDIKPENLFCVENDGLPLVKLLDFGISKIAVEESSSRSTGDLTMGTPCYMAPEQIRSTAAADERSDQWSLGVVLYELLAGKPPFEAPSITELCALVLEEDAPPLREVNPAIPEAIAKVVARCMEKDPARRFADIAEVAEALLPFAPSRALASAESASRLLAAARRASGKMRAAKEALAVPNTSEVPVVASLMIEGGQRRRRWAPLLGAVLVAASVGVFVTWQPPVALAPAARPPAEAEPVTTVEAPLVPAIGIGSSVRTPPPVESAAPAPPPPKIVPPPRKSAAPPPRASAPSATASAAPPESGPPTSPPTATTPQVELGY